MRLTDRASLLRAVFRLLDTDQGDGSLTEHDPSDQLLEGIYLHIQQGADDAQEYMLSSGSTYWNTTSGPLTFDDPDVNGFRSVALPGDFRQLQGDEDESALHTSTGASWGVEIPADMRWRAPVSNGYFIEQDKLFLTRRASGFNDLRMDYVRMIEELADGVTVDFPAEDRTLIVACAAEHACHEHWFVGGQEGMMKINMNLQTKKRAAFKRARRTGGPRKVRTPNVSGKYALMG